MERNKNNEIIDYRFVFAFLQLCNRELLLCCEDVIKILEKSGISNYELCINSIIDNLTKLGIIKEVKPIDVNYQLFRSKKIERLVVKSFNKTITNISSQVLNTLNTGSVVELNDYLNSYFKNQKKSKSLLNRVMRISRTENTITRSKIRNKVQEELINQGFNIKKKWVHTLKVAYNDISPNYKPRQDHLDLDGMIEDENGLFHTELGSSQGPGLFGVPEEDINCRCDTEFVLIDKN